MPSCSSGLPLRIGTMAGNSLSRALSGPQTRKACGLSVGGHAALACARPAVVGRSLRHAPCTHGLLLVRLMAHQHSPARASRGRPHTNPRAHAMHRPDAQGKGSRRRSSDLLAALASNPLGCLKASGGRRNARTGLPLSFLRWQASCAPQGRGRNTPTHQACLPQAGTRLWPVECTGQPTQPSNRRPNAPPIAVPHGSLASSTLSSALRSTRSASSKRSAPLVGLYSKGGRSGPARASPNPQRTNQRDRPLP